MNTILVIDSAVSGEASVSKTLVREAVAALTAAGPARVVSRDLGADAGAAPDRGDRRRRPRRARDRGRARRPRPLRRADRRAARRRHHRDRRADVQLQHPDRRCASWFDHVLRAGETFSYSEAGPEGLLAGKRVIVVESRGGLYSEGPAQAIDFQEPYLRHLLGFIGLTDVTFVRAEKIGYGPEARAAAIASATAALREVAAAGRSAA